MHVSCTKDNIARTIARVSTKVILPPVGSVHLNLTFACTRASFTSVKLRNRVSAFNRIQFRVQQSHELMMLANAHCSVWNIHVSTTAH